MEHTRRNVERILSAALSDQAIASWWASAQPELEGTTPVDWLDGGRDPQQVLAAAKHTAGALGH